MKKQFFHNFKASEVSSFERKQAEYILKSYFFYKNKDAPFLGYSRIKLYEKKNNVIPDIEEDLISKIDDAFKVLAERAPFSQIILIEIYRNNESVQSICKRYKLTLSQCYYWRKNGLAYIYKTLNEGLNLNEI